MSFLRIVEDPLAKPHPEVFSHRSWHSDSEELLGMVPGMSKGAKLT